MDEDSVFRAMHCTLRLVTDITARAAWRLSVRADAAHPVAFRKRGDAIAALVHGEIAVVAEYELVVRLAVSVAADVARLSFFLFFFFGFSRFFRLDFL